MNKADPGLPGRTWGIFFSKEVAEALKDKGVRPSDVMGNIRRFERKGLVYVRGYRSHDGQMPFKEGYLLTWIDQDKPREKAIGEAPLRGQRGPWPAAPAACSRAIGLEVELDHPPAEIDFAPRREAPGFFSRSGEGVKNIGHPGRKMSSWSPWKGKKRY